MTDAPSNVIDIMAARKKRRPDHGKWLLSMDVFLPIDPASQDSAEGMATAKVTAFDPEDGLTVANRLRGWAGSFEQLARVLRDQAHALEPDKDGQLLCVVNVWESSRVYSWTSNDVDGPDRVAWLHRRLDQAKDGIKPIAEAPAG